MLSDRYPVSLRATRDQLKQIQVRLEEYRDALQMAGAELEQRSRDMIALTHFAYQSSHLSNPVTLLQSALALALERVSTSAGAIVLIDATTRELTLGAHNGLTAELSGILTGKTWHEGAIALMPYLVTGAGALLENEAAEEEVERLLLATGNLSSLVNLPLKVATQLVGAFLVGLQGERRFKSAELCFLMALSQETAIALDSLRLREGLWYTAETLLGSQSPSFDWDKITPINLGFNTAIPLNLSTISPLPPSLENELQEVLATIMAAETELEQQYADFDALSGINEMMNRTLELGEILQVVVGQTRPILQADAVWIYLVDEKNQLEMRAHAGLSNDYLRGMHRLQQSDGLEGWVIRHNKSRLVEAVASDSKTAYKFWVDKEGLQALLAAPITRARREGQKPQIVEGVLVAGRRAGHTRAWSARELGLLTAIADQLAPAIQNARLYAQARENEASLQAGNQVLHEINEMLIKKNVDLEEFIGRDLEPTLAATLGVLEHMLAQDGSGSNEELNQKVLDLQNILSRLRGLAQDFT